MASALSVDTLASVVPPVELSVPAKRLPKVLKDDPLPPPPLQPASAGRIIAQPNREIVFKILFMCSCDELYKAVESCQYIFKKD